MSDQASTPDYQQETARLRTELLKWVVGQLSSEVDANGIANLPQHLRDTVDARAAQTLSAETAKLSAQIGAIPLPDIAAFRQDVLASLTADSGAWVQSLKGLEQRLYTMEASIARQTDLLNGLAEKVELPPVALAKAEVEATGDSISETLADPTRNESTGFDGTEPEAGSKSGTELRHDINGSDNLTANSKRSILVRAWGWVKRKKDTLFLLIIAFLMATVAYFVWQTLKNQGQDPTAEQPTLVAPPATSEAPTAGAPAAEATTTDGPVAASSAAESVPPSPAATANRSATGGNRPDNQRSNRRTTSTSGNSNVVPQPAAEAPAEPSPATPGTDKTN